MFRYPVIIEKANNNYSAYSPDLPGCIAAGQTVQETLEHMKETIQFHIEGLKQEGIQIPKPSTQITYIEIAI